tara:strand:- start:5387 stop:6289 length:903 start_codon:yes stop_codon:yes gene_type:complete
MAEENTPVESEVTPIEALDQEVMDLDRPIRVGGEEFTASEIAETMKNYEQLEEYARGLEGFKEATSRLMSPDTDSQVKKRDARQILLDMQYTPDQVDQWVKIYDQEPEMEERTPPSQQQYQQQQQQQRPQMDPRTDQLNDQVLKMRAQMLQQNLENSLSSSIGAEGDGKVLMDWLTTNRQPEDAAKARDSVAERVRSQALENLRQRRNYAGSFDDSWVDEEVKKATNKVAKDMLTVIGDTSKIGRVSETAGQNETLYRKEPVKLPNSSGKTFGEIEGQLRDWTSDQLLRSLADPGGDTKA